MERVIYGIKNCDTMQKAFKWMDTNGIKYRFHDYRVEGLTAAHIERWLQEIPLEVLVNSRSTTYKALSADQKELIAQPTTASVVILQNPSIIKRPLLDNKGAYIIGFKEEDWAKALK